MPIAILEERPDSPDATQLIMELDALLNALPYPQESRHAFGIDKLLREGVVFFVTRYEGQPAGCGGLKLFGQEYGEVKRMYAISSWLALFRAFRGAVSNQLHRLPTTQNPLSFIHEQVHAGQSTFLPAVIGRFLRTEPLQFPPS